MSFTINIYYTGENESAKKFAKEMVEKGLVERVRAEKGNQKYEYFFPMDDPETVLLIDRWENQEALDEHHKSPMMKEIADLREKYHLHMRVEQFIEKKNMKS
ncbi:antibiotic biosynthesis monooxygenase [Clostridium sp. CAG:354]|jgi:quinol monooxygenase YgiN|nr:antibiotic biosynthesis monooxygenase [Clostridium sp.]MBS5863240.1 antibiotic biosynthesis monooxygenase [Clostridium sp.]MEE0269282.1 putative quinol monooxygenase [Clostridia bacterium]CDE10168.1 antibiotic biosynthesis monooxygenase [Clostridium sp. CAG:354]